MALIKKPGRKVWIFKTKINGKTWERSTGETDRKKALAKSIELEKLAQLHRDQPSELPTLSKAILKEVERLETDASAQQAGRVSYALENFLKWAGDLALEKITTPFMETYQRQRLKKASKETVDKELCYLVRLLRLNGFRVDKPRSKPGKQTEVRLFSDEELRRFFAHCPEEMKSLFLLMLVTGARPAELIPSERSKHVALLKNEVNPERGTVTIRSAKVQSGRRGTVRVIRIPEEVMKLVVQTGREHRGEHVFPPYFNLFRYFDRILKDAEISKLDALGRKLTAHSFRHTWATLMAGSVGNNPFLLKTLLGHTQISTTDRYIHASAPEITVDVTPYLSVVGSAA